MEIPELWLKNAKYYCLTILMTLLFPNYLLIIGIHIHLDPTETICLCVTTPIPRLGHLQSVRQFFEGFLRCATELTVSNRDVPDG